MAFCLRVICAVVYTFFYESEHQQWPLLRSVAMNVGALAVALYLDYHHRRVFMRNEGHSMPEAAAAGGSSSNGVGGKRGKGSSSSLRAAAPVSALYTGAAPSRTD